MRIAIVGSRDFIDYKKFKEEVRPLLLPRVKDLMIVSGGARGTDTMAVQYAKEYCIPWCVFPPNWNKYGNRAGPLRNAQIVDFSDALIAFKADSSRGTLNAISLAKKKDMQVSIINI